MLSRDQIVELRKQIQKSRQETFEIHKRSMTDTARFLQHMYDPSPEYEGGSFEIDFYVSSLGKPALHYSVVDHNTPELMFGSFTLEVTDACDYDEIELVGSYWDEDEDDRLIGAVKHVVERLGARRVIYTVPSSDDGDIMRPQRSLDRWMDYLETRPANAERTHFVDVYVWEVPQL